MEQMFKQGKFDEPKEYITGYWITMQEKGFSGIMFDSLHQAFVFMKNGKRHRTDGPAIIYKERSRNLESADFYLFFIDDVGYTYKQFMTKTSKLGKALYGAEE